MLAYLLLPPAGAVLLLILEHKSDYVRFHAWQAAMVFSVLFVCHLCLVWSRVLSWLLFVGDLGVIGWGGWRAWSDGELGGFSFLGFGVVLCYYAFLGGWVLGFGLTSVGVADGLDRSELPFFGGLASSFVDSE